MTVNNQNNGPKVFTSTQAKSASIGEMKSIKVDTPSFRTVMDHSAGAQVRQGLSTAVGYLSQGAATVFGAMGLNQVAAVAAQAGQKMMQVGQMSSSGQEVRMTMDVKTLSGGNGGMGVQANAMVAGKQGQTSGGQTGGSPFGAGASGMKMSSNVTSGGGAAFGAGAGALPGMDGSTGNASGGISSMGSANTSNPIGAAAGGNSQDQLLNATKSMQETQMSFNLQYLQLQSQMQHENRSYTAISNIMKTKHDTVKNSISNVR